MTSQDQGMPLTFANAPRVTRDGGIFIDRDAALRLIDKLRDRDRELLDRLKNR